MLCCYLFTHSLGEACSHVAAVLSCVIKANELRKQSGMDACTSSLCSWNHSTKEVHKYFMDVAVAVNVLFRSSQCFLRT